MKVLQLVLLAVVGSAVAYSVSQNDEEAELLCVRLCGNCSGLGSFKDHVCVCHVTPDDSQCLAIAQKRAGFFDLRWKVQPEGKSDDSADSSASRTPSDSSVSHLRLRRASEPRANRVKRGPDLESILRHRRAQRSLQPLNGIYELPRSGVQETQRSGMYEIHIGNSGEDSVQLVFPQSDGLEVEHQYFYQGPDGVQHPCSHAVSDFDLSASHESYNFPGQGSGSLGGWNGGPVGFGDRARPFRREGSQNPNSFSSQRFGSTGSNENSQESRYPDRYHSQQQYDFGGRSHENSRNEDSYFAEGTTSRGGGRTWFDEARDGSWLEGEGESYELRREYSGQVGGSTISREGRERDGYGYEEQGQDYGTGSMADSTRPWSRDWDYTTTANNAY